MCVCDGEGRRVVSGHGVSFRGRRIRVGASVKSRERKGNEGFCKLA